MAHTHQEKSWLGRFGEEYTDRNYMLPDEFDNLLRGRIGISRSEQVDDFLSGLEINNILEVGCNVGNQLLILQKRGFSNLFGIELQWYAVQKAQDRTKRINIIQGSAFDIPVKILFLIWYLRVDY